MSLLKAFYARVSRLGTWKHVAREFRQFETCLQTAEQLARIHRVPEAEVQPPEFARAMLDLQRSLDELHEAIADRRARVDEDPGAYAATGSSSSPNRRSTIHSALKGI